MTPSSTPSPAQAAGALAPARRWLVPAIALLVLVLVGWRAYEWFAHDVAQRRAVAEGRAPAPAPAVPADDAPPAPAAAPQEPAAPAVRGDAINRCVRGAEVLFSNQPCPPGFTLDAGRAGGAPAQAAPATLLAGADTPAEREALCAYVTAEVQRLDFEFQQPLPPPILDDISSRLLVLRSQGERLRCVLPQPSTPQGRPGAPVLDEKPAAAPAGRQRRKAG